MQAKVDQPRAALVAELQREPSVTEIDDALEAAAADGCFTPTSLDAPAGDADGDEPSSLPQARRENGYSPRRSATVSGTTRTRWHAVEVLVTGATGYVGSRLVPHLVQVGHGVVAASRNESSVERYPWSGDVEIRRFDVEDDDLVAEAVQGVDAVIYLVHSMESTDFVRKDREAARRVSEACAAAGVGRIVYVSGLVPPGDLSDHLRSRAEVEQVLTDGAVPTTTLRASMIIGAGSTSFELLRRLSERIPRLTPVPRWMDRDIQPVAIDDVAAVVGHVLAGPARDASYDIGGDDVLSYPDLLATYADVAGLRRRRVLVPGVPVAVASRASAAISGLDRTEVVTLMRSLKKDMVCDPDRYPAVLLPDDHRWVSVREALARSLKDSSEGTTYEGDTQARADTDPS